MKVSKQSRRKFVKQSALAGALFSMLPKQGLSSISYESTDDLPISIFSKHLQFLDYEEMASKAREIGFDGVDLTVRPGGHVLPENVQRDLPKAVYAIRKEGLTYQSITTAVEDATNPVDQNVLSTASELGVGVYRMNWYRYPDGRSMPESMNAFQQKIEQLSVLNQELGITGCYQNHAGNLVGASLWEVYEMIRLANPEHFGVQYDIRHATVEGGVSWPTGLRLVQDNIKTIVFKDFKWEEQQDGWKLVNTPIGEGMVDFKRYFQLLKQYKIVVPAILHLEYPLGGAEHGKGKLTCDPEIVYQAMRKDLETIKRLWKEA